METLSLSQALLPPPQPGTLRRNLFRLGLIALAAAALAWSWVGTEMSFGALARSGPHLAAFLDRMLPPDFGWQMEESRPFPPPLRLITENYTANPQHKDKSMALWEVASLPLPSIASSRI